MVVPSRLCEIDVSGTAEHRVLDMMFAMSDKHCLGSSNAGMQVVGFWTIAWSSLS